jgi:hypothetical protein
MKLLLVSICILVAGCAPSSKGLVRPGVSVNFENESLYIFGVNEQNAAVTVRYARKEFVNGRLIKKYGLPNIWALPDNG